MPRVLSGVQPTGEFHIGTYLGALRSWVGDQDANEAYYCIVDLHALTSATTPDELRSRTLGAAINLLAVGLDPNKCTIFVQSQVPEHPRLAWLLECVATMGELGRMTQFKDKRGTSASDTASVGLFTYPVLQAADILLYDAERVPIGEDQRQHLELTRDLARRFNKRYSKTFTVPAATIPTLGARVMDLQYPTRKMSKSYKSPLGTINMLDEPSEIERKVKRAVTDNESEVRFDPENKPGVSNLVELLGAATGSSPASVASSYQSYGDLKRDVGEALAELLRPIRERHAELSKDIGSVSAIIEEGNEAAHGVAEITYNRAAHAVGLG